MRKEKGQLAQNDRGGAQPTGWEGFGTSGTQELSYTGEKRKKNTTKVNVGGSEGNPAQ